MQIRPDSLFAKYIQQQSLRETARSNSVGANSASGNQNEFFDLIRNGVSKVNSMQLESQDSIERMLAGEDIESAEVLTGIQKTDMAFRLLVQVRNKLMQAYDEINNIRI